MLRKAGLATVVLLPIAAAATHTGDVRQLYNEMYPVNALKRDAFSLCHESDPNFVRALQGDRESCFDRMPHSIALAIGRVRPGTELAMFETAPATERVSALFFAQAEAMRSQERSVAARPALAEARPECGSGGELAALDLLNAARRGLPQTGPVVQQVATLPEGQRLPVLPIQNTAAEPAESGPAPTSGLVPPNAPERLAASGLCRIRV